MTPAENCEGDIMEVNKVKNTANHPAVFQHHRKSTSVLKESLMLCSRLHTSMYAKNVVYYSHTQNGPKIECGMMDTSHP